MSTKEEEDIYLFDMIQLLDDDVDADKDETTEVQPCHEDEISAAESSSQSSQSTTLQSKISEVHPKSFRGRLYSKLIERENVAFKQRVESRRKRLIEEGIVNEEESLELVNDPDDLPTQIQQRVYDQIAEEKEETRVKLLQKNLEDASKVYKNSWVLKKESEMVDYCKKRSTCQDPEMCATLDSLIEIVENKLKQFHEKEGTIHEQALEERRKVCLSLGHVTEDMLEAIQNVYHRLPMVLDPCVPMTPPRSQLGDEVPKTPSWSPTPGTSSIIMATPVRLDSEEDDMNFATPPQTPSYKPRESPQKSKKKRKKKKQSLPCTQKRLTQFF